jgi:hypothetical protein
MAVNDRHRAGDGEGPDLWTADQVAGVFPRAYAFGVPTFAPVNWPAPAPVAQDKYTRRFTEAFAIVKHVLPMAGVVVAGGAAAWPLGRPSGPPASDIDLFIIAPPDEPAGSDREAEKLRERSALWKKVDRLVAALRHSIFSHTGASEDTQTPGIVEILSPGVVTLAVPERYPRAAGRPYQVKIQIILRAFPSVSVLLHGFDVPACSVAYDGRRTYLTTLAAYAHVFGVNAVNPAYRSTTYETRLEKYFERGFALALPYLRRGAFAVGEPLALPHLTLTPVACRGPFASGTITLPRGAPSSDYEPEPEGIVELYAREGEVVFGPRRETVLGANAFQVVSGENRFRITQVRGRADGPAEDGPGLPFAGYASNPDAFEPTLEDALPRRELERHLDRIAAGSVDCRGAVQTRALRVLFGMSPNEVAMFTAAVCEAGGGNPGFRLDPLPALAPFRAAVLAKYDVLPPKIEWWITTDPSRQYTASLNPRFEDPAVWYGSVYEAAPHPYTPEDYVEALLGLLGLRATQAQSVHAETLPAGECTICHGAVGRGDLNSITLACGHVFHWWERDGCQGLYPWAVGHTSCPNCRGMFGMIPTPPRASPRPRDLPRVQLVVAWPSVRFPEVDGLPGEAPVAGDPTRA